MTTAGTHPVWTSDELSALDWAELAPATTAHAPDVVRDEGFMSTWDGARLFWRGWIPADADAIRGRLLLQHGYGEHSGRYDHVAVAFARAGYEVYALEARGHGRSEGARGHVTVYDDYVRDLSMFASFIREERGEDRVTFVLGHSNGGLITLRWALRRPDHIAGFVVTSPMCGFAVAVPKWKEVAGKVMSRVLPKFSMPSEIPATDLCHDEKVTSLYERDPLVHKVATAGWFEQAKLAQQDLMERAERIDHPLLMLVGGSDRIVDPRASERVFHQIEDGDRELEVYPSLFHEILNEPEWADITRRTLAWMEAHRATEAPADAHEDAAASAEEE